MTAVTIGQESGAAMVFWLCFEQCEKRRTVFFVKCAIYNGSVFLFAFVVIFVST
jgi:hypothetical protein